MAMSSVFFPLLLCDFQKDLQNLKDASDDLMLIDDDVIPYPVPYVYRVIHVKNSET